MGLSLLEFTGKKQRLCENAWLTLYEDWPPLSLHQYDSAQIRRMAKAVPTELI